MARRTIEELTDDLDGSPADRTVGFGYAGTDYELELGEEHAAQLAAAFERYVAAARRVGEKRGSGRRAGGRSTGRRPSGRSAAERGAGTAIDPTVVRAWAQANGIEVSGRGRISSEVLEAYRAAQG